MNSKEVPFTRLLFKSDNEIIAGNYSGIPVLLTINKDGVLELTQNISEGVNTKKDLSKSNVAMISESF